MTQEPVNGSTVQGGHTRNHRAGTTPWDRNDCRRGGGRNDEGANSREGDFRGRRSGGIQSGSHSPHWLLRGFSATSPTPISPRKASLRRTLPLSPPEGGKGIFPTEGMGEDWTGGNLKKRKTGGEADEELQLEATQGGVLLLLRHSLRLRRTEDPWTLVLPAPSLRRRPHPRHPPDDLPMGGQENKRHSLPLPRTRDLFPAEPRLVATGPCRRLPPGRYRRRLPTTMSPKTKRGGKRVLPEGNPPPFPRFPTTPGLLPQLGTLPKTQPPRRKTTMREIPRHHQHTSRTWLSAHHDHHLGG